MEFVTLT